MTIINKSYDTFSVISFIIQIAHSHFIFIIEPARFTFALSISQSLERWDIYNGPAKIDYHWNIQII